MLKKIQKNMNKRGFTLVELIIVIAVMAILAAIVVPRMTGITGSFKEKADTRVCDNYAREIEVKIQLGEAIDGNGAADGTPQYGLVSNVISEAAGETPQSLTTGNYYFVINGTNVYVYVSATAPTNTTAPTTGVFVQRKNAQKIDN